MSSNLAERLIFEAEWYDKVASMVKKFYLYFFPADNSVELFDLKTRKIFLRRTKCEGIEAKNLYVGAVITIFSRPMKITATADDATRNKLAFVMQKTFGMIKPDATDRMGEILKTITNHDLHSSNIKMIKLSNDDVNDFYRTKTEQELKVLRKHMTSGPILALELMGENCIERWRQLIGPRDSLKAREEAPTSLRACYGKDSIANALHGSDDQHDAEKKGKDLTKNKEMLPHRRTSCTTKDSDGPFAISQELQFFFPDGKTKKKFSKNTATFKNCTCCIIKPHAIHSRLTGDIIDNIQKAGYNITAIQQFLIDPVNVEEFLEVYRGVLPEYGAMVAELQSGPCIALEITHTDENFDVPVEFRKFCGPMDPDIARQVRPDTLRAKYGKTKVQNAVHCSDLPEDGLLEVEYFFKILADE